MTTLLKISASSASLSPFLAVCFPKVHFNILFNFFGLFFPQESKSNDSKVFRLTHLLMIYSDIIWFFISIDSLIHIFDTTGF
jgi:hypothetical protein